MTYTKAGRRALPYPQHRNSVDEGIAEGYLSACEQENRQLRTEVERLRQALQGIANNPDPLEGKCYCRWSQGVARQALAGSNHAD